MAKRIGIDKWLFGVTVLLVFIGLVMVFSASAVMAKERYGSAYTFLIRQSILAGLGLIAMLVLMRIDYRKLRNPAVVFSLLGITGVCLLAVFFNPTSHNTHRWLALWNFSFQPSELAKPAIIIFLAYFLEKRIKQIDDWKHTLLPAIVPSVVFVLLIVKQPDLGTAMVCLAITAVILYIAGMQPKYFGYALIPILPALYFLLFHVGWRRDRMIAFLDPFADPMGRGFHMVQSLIAVGTGGIMGQGLMEGKQKLFYLPEPHTDFIFAVTAEELGLVGAMTVVLLFGVFCYRGLRATMRSTDLFGKYLALGITASIVIQAFFNVSVVLGLLPTKGIPLPFISYGGTSILLTLAMVGILLNITQQTE